VKKIAIIGAGISGLSTAHFLKKDYEVTVFEKESNPGGLIRCRRVNGSLFHTCGGHVLNSKRQDFLDWFWSKFGCEEEFSKAERNAVVFMDKSNVIPYPMENHMYLFDAEIQKRFINDLLLVSKKECVKPLNFAEFLINRFGETLYNLYFKPYNEKVWRRDLKQVPLSWLEGKLPMPTVAEMIFNNINHVKENSFVHSTFWYEKMNGSQFIADKLSKDLNIKYNTNVNSLSYNAERRMWTVYGDEFNIIIFCGNIKDMVKMIDGIDVSEYKQDIANLQYHGTTSVFCEIDENPYSWIYLPSSMYESHRIICTGNFAATNNDLTTPKGRITATIEFTDKTNKVDILDNLTRLPFNPKYLDHQFNQYTYPIQDNYTRLMIQRFKADIAPLNLFFTGRFANWEYYNMDIAVGAAIDLCNGIKQMFPHK
jgi:protoporphyrinogen oxidase